MPRKGLVFRRAQATDPVYASDIVEKFICSMMWEGKKSTAQRVFYGAMDQVAKKTNDDALKIFKKAIENVKPLQEPWAGYSNSKTPATSGSWRTSTPERPRRRNASCFIRV